MLRGDLIYNPSAGRFPSGMLAERAANVLRGYGWEIDLYQTDNGHHITSLAQRAAEQGRDGLFVVGGDGSVNLAARGLIGSQTALGVLADLDPFDGTGRKRSPVRSRSDPGS
jgi:diacylglycerol kinase family enzyme